VAFIVNSSSYNSPSQQPVVVLTIHLSSLIDSWFNVHANLSSPVNTLEFIDDSLSLIENTEFVIDSSSLVYSSKLVVDSSLLVFVNAHSKIRKRMDTDVAFTQEYSKVSISTRNVKCSSMNQGRLRVKIEKCFCG
jgi:hypothetical protein